MNAPSKSKTKDLRLSLLPPRQFTPDIITHVHKGGPEDLLVTMNYLERWLHVNDCGHTQKRSSERYSYQGKMLLLIDAEEIDEYTSLSNLPYICIEVEGRNLSQGGASFVCPSEIISRQLMGEDTEVLNLDRLVTVNNSVAIGLRQADNSMRWLDAILLRLRELRGGHSELNIAFCS